ncbi:interferon-inducible GTPase 5-like [Trachemys scripta elegans]|uniref:interferon-inducible GTPase 5-like n=1 Tax=Trachemys scripta elegans TaxID=31138 RepID=UPI001551F492|nr:interferon-inducible GTPase 5-like [Trachemys scripta elegans]
MSTEDFKAEVKAGNLARAVSIAQEIMNRRFAVAVIGMLGSGVSSFINAIKDLKNYDAGAAQIALVGKRTNRSPTSYRHPTDLNLYFCDMPEISCSDFKADKYLEQVGFDPYDFFIIIASERFINVHTELAKEIQRRGKSFFFVRSKVDNVLAEMAEESDLRRIREECTERLRIAGLTDHQVFLISSSRLSCYDFPLLKETLSNKILSQEREKLLDISQSTLQEKKKEKLMPAIGKSIQAGGVATAVWLAPFDNYDADIVIDIVKGYYKDYGLDDDSLSTLAGHAGQDVKDLKAVMTCPQASEITTNYISDILIKYTPIESKVLRRVPVLGGAFCMARTGGVMLRFLNELTENTNSVLRKALEGKGRKSE